MAYTGGLRDTCLNRKFSIVLYGIQDSLYQRTPQFYEKFRDSLVNNLNRAFAPICVSFQVCSLVMIPHYIFNVWRFQKTDQAAVQGWYTPNVINIYMPDLIDVWPSNHAQAYAYSNGVWGAVQNTLDVLVVSAAGYETNNVGQRFSDAIHAMGHYFGLPDTYANLGPPVTPPPPSFAISAEFVDGSNSAVNGDLFTDTEADPFPFEWWLPPFFKHVNCNYGLDATDGKGHTYTPPLDNFMSQWGCRCKFTQEQRNHMARFILQNRLHLH